MRWGRQQRRMRGARDVASMGMARALPETCGPQATAGMRSMPMELASAARPAASRAERGNMFDVEDRRLALAWKGVICNR